MPHKMRLVPVSARSARLALIAAVLLALGFAGPATGADRVGLRGSVPPYAAPSAAAGPVPADERLSFDVVLGLRDRAGARALAERVSDPRSDSYGEFVSADRFRQRFSWRPDEIRPVARWLRRRGMKVGRPTPNGVLLPATGTAAEFEHAFGTKLGVFSAFGRELVAPRLELSVPRSISDLVLGTIGVPEAPVSLHLAGARNGAGAATAVGSGGLSADPGPPPLGFDDGVVAEQPPPPLCSRYWGAKFGGGLPKAFGQRPLLSICGYNAKQIRSAYGAQRLYRKGIDGSGVDIGIVVGHLSPTLQPDLNKYSKDNGIPRTRLRIRKPSRYTPAPSIGIWGLYTEQTLDVQVSHGVAPGARIHYSGPDAIKANGEPDFSEQIAADSQLVDRNRVEVISNSWALPEVGHPRAHFRAGEDIFMQAAAQGITMLGSSGDVGDGIEEFNIRTVQYPASSRWVTAVGGTTLNVGPTNQRVWEQGWGEAATALDQTTDTWTPQPPGSYIGGTTGGTSRVFREPGYQRGRVPKRYSAYYGGRGRVVPDVALIADRMSGPGLVQTAVDPATETRVVTRHSVGGTSVASPVLAGVVAMMADRNGGRLGFLNPSLYRVGSRAVRRIGPARPPAVSATVSYANFLDAGDGANVELFTGGRYGTLTVRRGYDDVTGLGSPSARVLAKRLRRMSR